MKKFTCSICGKEFDNIDQYVEHVSKCAEEHKKKESEDLQKLNDDLNRVKAAKAYYEEQLAKFKENYPEAYKLNFATEGSKECSKANTVKKPESKLLEETLEELKADPFMRYMLKTLGIE